MHLTSFADHLTAQYGAPDTPTRDEYEAGFEGFRLGVLLQELRKEKGLTQAQLAEKCGTTKPTFPASKTMPPISASPR